MYQPFDTLHRTYKPYWYIVDIMKVLLVLTALVAAALAAGYVHPRWNGYNRGYYARKYNFFYSLIISFANIVWKNAPLYSHVLFVHASGWYLKPFSRWAKIIGWISLPINTYQHFFTNHTVTRNSNHGNSYRFSKIVKQCWITILHTLWATMPYCLQHFQICGDC